MITSYGGDAALFKTSQGSQAILIGAAAEDRIEPQAEEGRNHGEDDNLYGLVHESSPYREARHRASLARDR